MSRRIIGLAATAAALAIAGAALASAEVYPDVADPSHASPAAAAAFRSFFTAKSAHRPADLMQHFARTKVFPIMHVIAMRRPVYEANPWIARNLYNAFEE